MNILYHHRTLADGAEGIHIDAMVQAFRQLGHDVNVGGVGVSDGRTSRAGLVDRIRTSAPAWAFELAAVALNAKEYLDVRRELRARQADLLYKRHARYDIGALAAARRLGVRSILEVNSLFSVPPYADFEPPALAGVAGRLERRALELATYVVAVSTPLAEQARMLGAERVVVLPNGVDPDRFDPDRADRAGTRARLGLGDRITIGWCGILRDWHGVDLLIDAMDALPDAALLIVGDGPSRPALEARAAAGRSGAQLVVTGRVPHADMPHYLSAMDIAVVAADRTGVASPMKLLEYMAMARAVVAPRTPNITDVAEHERTALLFEPGSAAGMAGAVARLAASPALRESLGRHARLAVAGQRTWRGNATAILRLLDGVEPTAGVHTHET